MTQHEKIIDMCKDGEFHCQIQFWNLFIRSPHKRRGEIEKKGVYEFEDRKCEHGVRNGLDYRMKLKAQPQLFKPEAIWSPREIERKKLENQTIL